DAQAVKLYGDAFGQDQEFFAFYRSLQAYREALNGRDTSFVLTPDSPFFRYFEGWLKSGTRTGASDSAPAPGAANPSASTPAAALIRRREGIWPAVRFLRNLRPRAAPPSISDGSSGHCCRESLHVSLLSSGLRRSAVGVTLALLLAVPIGVPAATARTTHEGF